MNIYDRIINILLEAKVEDYLSRVDEIKANPARREVGKDTAMNVQKAKHLGTGVKPDGKLGRSMALSLKQRAERMLSGK